MVLISASSLQLQLLNRRPEGPLCWVLVFSTASYLQLPDFLSLPGLYNSSTSTFLWASQIALNSTHPRSRLYPDIPRPVAPFIYTGAFPILTAWLGSICYTSYKNTNLTGVGIRTFYKKILKTTFISIKSKYSAVLLTKISFIILFFNPNNSLLSRSFICKWILT